MKRPPLPRLASGLLLLVLLLLSLSANAARLEVDRNEIPLGETATILLKGAPFIAVVAWKVSPELEVLESSDKRIRVRGIREGAGSVNCEMNLSVHTANIRVSRAGGPPTSMGRRGHDHMDRPAVNPDGGRSYSAEMPIRDEPGPRAMPPARDRSGGLIAHLTMEGRVVDRVSGQPAEKNGTRATRDRMGRDGGALQFDGKSYLQLPLDINPGGRPELTMAAWVRSDAPQPIQQVLSHDNGGYDRSLGIDHRGGGAGWSAFAGSSGVLGVKPVQVGKWTFIAAVWNQSAQTVRLYVDDEHFDKQGSSGNGHGYLRIGMNPSYGEHFRGAIDEVWVFERALEEDEIAQLRGSEPNQRGDANLALNKRASQSSRSQWSHQDDAQGAVDGVINGSYAFHTDNQANPWWQVDLGDQFRLGEAIIYNRLDCCAERARTLQVMLSGDGRRWRTVYRHDGRVFGGKDGNPLKVALNGERARYVRLQLNEGNWFHLDEVEVMGMPEGGRLPPMHRPNDSGRSYSADRPDGGRGYTADRPLSDNPVTDEKLQFELNKLRDMYKR